MYQISCIMHHASCIIHLVSCIMHHAAYIMHLVSCILYLVSCILHPVSCIVYPVSCIMYHVSCILYNLSRIMYRHTEDVAYDAVSSITGDGKIYDVQDEHAQHVNKSCTKRCTKVVQLYEHDKKMYHHVDMMVHLVHHVSRIMYPVSRGTPYRPTQGHDAACETCKAVLDVHRGVRDKFPPDTLTGSLTGVCAPGPPVRSCLPGTRYDGFSRC